MRRSVVGWGVLLVLLVVGGAFGRARAADGLPVKFRPVAAGPLVLNPRDVIAVYRPADGSSVGVLIGKPGGAVQQIVLKDFREAAAVFNELWNNQQWVKDPGDEDARPLTRMLVKPKQGEEDAKRVPVLIVNADRVLGIGWDSDRRVAHVYIDRAPGAAAGADETLELTREEAEGVIAAYKMAMVR
ncbi:MAG TPA: hypothetical protein VEA69_17810 [Tepidisphaeraceae bacterium]|nr:hypothetical protein [Tepidisphaeraceae bacterium]